MRDFLTQTEAANLLGVSRKTLSVWLERDPELRKCLTGPMPRRRYIDRAAFLAWKARAVGISPFDEM